MGSSVLLLLLATLHGAWAVNAEPAVATPQQGLVSLLDDLSGSRPPDRLFAARELRRQVRGAIRATRRNRPGSLASDDAMAQLEDFDRTVAPRCISVLGKDDVRLHCAEILGMLETAEALAPLRAALEQEQRPRVRRHIQRAITLVEEGNAPGEDD